MENNIRKGRDNSKLTPEVKAAMDKHMPEGYYYEDDLTVEFALKLVEQDKVIRKLNEKLNFIQDEIVVGLNECVDHEKNKIKKEVGRLDYLIKYISILVFSGIIQNPFPATHGSSDYKVINKKARKDIDKKIEGE